MKIIYMNWRQNRNKAQENEFNDINLLTMAVSTIKARTYGNQTKLYGDLFTYEFLEHSGLLGLWDEVDGWILDKQIDTNDFDVSYFFNIGKFFALQQEEAPVMMVDIDLIIWQNLNTQLLGQEALFTHWEAVRPVNDWYCGEENLRVPNGYEWNRRWDFKMKAANTSIMYFKDERVKSYYCEQAIRYLYHNFISEKESIRPEVYFVEQRLFLMCMKELELLGKTLPIIDTLWSPVKGAFIKKDPHLGWWDFFIPESNQRITHTWIAKKAIASNRLYRDYYCCRMLEELVEMKPQLTKYFEKLNILDRYFQLLDQYGTVEHMIQAGAVSNKLYN